MRNLKISALALACIAGGLALSQASAMAQPMTHEPEAMIDRPCSNQAKDGDYAAFREHRIHDIAAILQLNDAQKAALKELVEARAKERADLMTSLCASKSDLSSLPQRLAFHEQMMQSRLDAMKAEAAKLLAFYNNLDEKQKAAFEVARKGMLFHFLLPMMGPAMMEQGDMMEHHQMMMEHGPDEE